jgi:hypothetical protein
VSGGWRPLVVRAIDAIADGETEVAVAALWEALDGPGGARPAGAVCARCGSRLRWPGLRDAHTVFCAAPRAADVLGGTAVAC